MRILEGTIVSNKMTRTVVVRVDRLRLHSKYRKYYRVSQKYKADVANAGDYQPGDVVRMQESRPLSRDKRWKVLDIVKRAPRSESVVEVEATIEETPAQDSSK